MNILFTHSYFYKLDPKQWRFHQPYPPLATLLAAAVIRDESNHVTFFDSNLRDRPEEIIPVLKSNKPDYLVIYDDGFNYLTKMCLSVMREAAFTLIREGKKAACQVIVASSDSSDHYQKYLAEGADYIVRGEGEETLNALLGVLSKNSEPLDVSGIAYLQNGMAVTTQPRPVMKNLDTLPLPAWDLVDVTAYEKIWRKHHGYFSLNLATTRGCPFKCNWCAKPIYGNRYNSRSPEHVIAEIEYLIEKFHPDHFWMCDDIFGLKPHWVSRFNQLVKEKDLKFKYKIQSRVDLLLEAGTVQSLAESGCETVWVGAESGSQKILDAMDKGTTVTQIGQATQKLKHQGIKVAYFLQFGYPGETRKEIDETLSMVLREMPDEIGISVSYPLPGTRFYENVKSQLQGKQNWTDSDDLAMMYQGTYPAAYYKILQRYVHSRYRIQRGFNRIREFITRPAWYVGDFRKLASMIYHLPITAIHAFRLKRLSSHG